MTTDPEQELAEGLAALGLQTGNAALSSLLAYAAMVMEHNARTNLTGAKSMSSFVTQILDSLTVLTAFDLRSPVIDLGSGAGLPGIPIAVVRPAVRMILVEPRAKRVEFLHHAVSALELGNVSVVKTSALGPGAKKIAGTAGTVLVRAVAEPQRAFALVAQLLRPGGAAILYQGKAGRASPQDVKAARRAGLHSIKIKSAAVPGLSISRFLWRARRRQGRV